MVVRPPPLCHSRHAAKQLTVAAIPIQRKPGDSTPELHVLLHILLQNGKQRPHVFKLLRQPRLSPTRAQGRPFLQLLLGILYRTEEEAHATGEQSTVEGIVGLETTDLLYEILRVKRLAKDEIGGSLCPDKVCELD